MSIETITLTHGVTVHIEQDQDAESPAEWDNVGQIAYLSKSRECLGTEGVSQERMEEIRDGIAAGTLIGLPVYAYVHSGSSITCGRKLKDGTLIPGNPYPDPEWDSGQSGFVYCTKAKAIKEFGKKLLTPKVREAALKCLAGEVDTFDQWLRGDVYGYVVTVDGAITESCWGFFGLDYAREEALSAGKAAVLEQTEEATERAACEERDIVTVAL